MRLAACQWISEMCTEETQTAGILESVKSYRQVNKQRPMYPTHFRWRLIINARMDDFSCQGYFQEHITGSSKLMLLPNKTLALCLHTTSK